MSDDSSFQLPSWLPESLRADPKKTVIMSGLLVVLCIVMMRTFWTSPTSSALAATADDAQIGRATVSGRASGESVSRSTSAARAWLKQPIKTVGRNLFALRGDQFPTAGKPRTHAAASMIYSNFWAQLEKSRSEQADQKRRREIQIQSLQRVAATIKLQSIVASNDPAAMVDGKIYRPGQSMSIASSDGEVMFKILRIEAQTVLVENDGIRLELQMKH